MIFILFNHTALNKINIRSRKIYLFGCFTVKNNYFKSENESKWRTIKSIAN